MSTPVLLDIGPAAYTHQAQVDEVKRQLGIDHNYFDCWIYGFLENKNFNISETVAKLNRRQEFERSELGESEITDWMMENMQKGIIQVIGNDKAGRVTFYICTGRDKPSPARREESKKNFDMFISYGTRLRPESKRCQMAMLINQDKASLWSNLDMTFQADIALRIAKYYPGCVDKMYICKMGRALSALAKPIFSRLPSIVSDRIIIVSDGDIKNGKLLELYDKDVLPVALGGENDCDKQENYTCFAYTIKEYFEQLRAAVRRGSSVKEWELNNLRATGDVEGNSRMDALKRSFIEPNASVSRPVTAMRGGSYLSASDANRSWSAVSGNGEISENDDCLLTCDTISVEMKHRPVNTASTTSAHSGQRARMETYLQNVPRDLFTDYVGQFSVIEGFLRINISEMFEREWLAILQREVEERQNIIRLEDQFQTESLFRALPPALHLIVKGFLWLSLMTMSTYFFMGTLFIALWSAPTLVYLFFSMFSQTYNVFLYGAAFVVTGVQFCIFCSRGYDLARNTFNGKLIQALKAFGNRALAFQAVIYVLGTVAYFVVFCVMASRYDVLTGLQFSVAYGWIVAVCITTVYHFFFAFGFRKINKMSYRHGSRVNNAETTLYLFMDVELDEDSGNGRSATEVVVLTLVGLLAFAAGVSYILTNGEVVFFLSATVTMLAFLLVLCTMFVFASSASSSSSVALAAVLYACLFWVNAVFTMTMHGWRDGWGGSLLATLFVMLFFCITCFVSVYGHWRGAVHRWLFRISWGLIVLHVLGCVVVLCVYNYRMGLFVAALAVHLLICCLRTNEASSSYGIFTVVCSFTAALLACCLLGNYVVGEVYESSVSQTLLPNYNASLYVQAGGAHPLTKGGGSQMPPLCLMRFPTDTLGVVGLALFAKLGYNDNAAAQQEDLQHWFPDFKRTVSFHAGAATPSSELVETTVFRRETAEYNTTVVAVRTGRNAQRMIEAMTMWIAQYCISFFSVLMPKDYLESIMPFISFAQDMTPLLWKQSTSTALDLVMNHIGNVTGPNEHVYIVGHGTAGASAAVAALRSQLPVSIVLFSAPEVIRSVNGLDMTEVAMADRLVNVRTNPSVLNSWYLHAPHDQMIPCDLNGKQCDELDTTIRTLDQICRA